MNEKERGVFVAYFLIAPFVISAAAYFLPWVVSVPVFLVFGLLWVGVTCNLIVGGNK
jgi:predicted LPLAT superfamily acyltransferase